MGLLSGLTKVGLAKKAVDEARKPENQRRIKKLFSRSKGGSGGRAA
jgi:hypothetical protein